MCNPSIFRLALCLILIVTLGAAAERPAYAYHTSSDLAETAVTSQEWDAILQRDAGAETQTEGSVLQTQSSPVSYKVRSGDTLYRISRSFGIPVETLLTVNGINDPGSLQAGQQLQIPSEQTGIDLPGGQEGIIRQVLTSTLTAYTAGVESTGKKPSHPEYGITYSGSKAEEGRTIAVDPSVIPMGSTVFIDGIGVRKAEDIGSAIRGTRIDLFMDDVEQARDFGVKKNVKVYVLEGTV
ncbi:3D domain-containing protein [Paenibacillus oleatilyticus]|uniref:3D domain-containing protein n=1 Tax=Paenibacillus oleatilyticus TaxID=2594886 RepID=UPI001C1F7E88|nr:3D domain-containing protein [Paenibacillus oleatilyticus]MBU7318673.1 LysM peptidoglycan-binding domain-containing protein [Paenibacillus oleatilyticus]